MRNSMDLMRCSMAVNEQLQTKSTQHQFNAQQYGFNAQLQTKSTILLNSLRLTWKGIEIMNLYECESIQEKES